MPCTRHLSLSCLGCLVRGPILSSYITQCCALETPQEGLTHARETLEVLWCVSSMEGKYKIKFKSIYPVADLGREKVHVVWKPLLNSLTLHFQSFPNILEPPQGVVVRYLYWLFSDQ
jgi:hypothetical protein